MRQTVGAATLQKGNVQHKGQSKQKMKNVIINFCATLQKGNVQREGQSKQK
jgi:hypothetical protein